MNYADSVRRFVLLLAARLLVFIPGWMSTKYPDWRQVVGAPLLLIGSLPDALFVKYVCSPRSPEWPWVMVVSLMLSSVLFVGVYELFHAHRLTSSQ
jgi:hypothetical protein